MKKRIEKSSSGKRTLAQKLGINPDLNTLFVNVPKGYFSWVSVDEIHFLSDSSTPWQFAHLFLTTTNKLEYWLNHLRHRIDPSGMIWVSWNKKSSGITTELTEDIIRDAALAIGLVDIKVCSINEKWSALKLVIRKELR